MARLCQRPAAIPECPLDVPDSPRQYDNTPRKRRSLWSTVSPVNDSTPCRNQRRTSWTAVTPVANSPVPDRSPRTPQKSSAWSNDNTPRGTQKNSTWSNDNTSRRIQRNGAWGSTQSAERRASGGQQSLAAMTERRASGGQQSIAAMLEKRASGGQQSLAAMTASIEEESQQSNHANPGCPNLWTTTRTAGRKASGGPLTVVQELNEGTSLQFNRSNPPTLTYPRSPVPKVNSLPPLENEQGGTSFYSEGSCSTASSVDNAKGNALQSRLRAGIQASAASKQPEAAQAALETKAGSNQPARSRPSFQRRKSKEEIDADFQDFFKSEYGQQYPLSSPALQIDTERLTSSTQVTDSELDSKTPVANYAEGIARQQDVQQTLKSQDEDAAEKDGENNGDPQNYTNRMKNAVNKVSALLKSVKAKSQALAHTGDLNHDLQAQDILNGL